MDDLRDKFAISAFEVLMQAVFLGSPQGKDISIAAREADEELEDFIGAYAYVFASSAVKARG